MSTPKRFFHSSPICSGNPSPAETHMRKRADEFSGVHAGSASIAAEKTTSSSAMPITPCAYSFAVSIALALHASAMETAKLYAQGVMGIAEDDVVFSAAMLADPACTPENSSARLRMCVSAGEGLPEHIGLEWKKRFGVDIYDGVGSTEMLHIFLGNYPGKIRYGTSGVPIPGYQARLIDEQGREVGEGEIGELSVRGTTAADGYWNQREKTRRTFEGEWTRTGDKYVREPDGFYRICGRTDDMFKVSGQWVSPYEVEAALITHPRVLEAAVVPKEDDDGLLKPKAYIVLKGEGTTPGAEELQ